ncbi:hypothetical protein [Sphingomonas sp.]|jgi:hypothetical protein|uniref:hypothetical protein n=1 Tax=Sphingomonas sp. TaxID=28214 RepID=UPI002D804DA6|nr:hypothetical protein [Sphingomonas sp.]HEU0045467.1 hypothetical protein [Sphingomonas sp.]
MLFSEFFPRLRDRALQRYGEVLTERQFTGWREDGLLPGPAAPIGRGRGRSPDRHWSLASYRRALRICRYKSWGAGRKSQWWLALWLSGEVVLPSIIVASLKRECSINRRGSRRLADSNRWRNSTFTTVDDIVPGRPVEAVRIGDILKLFGVTPDQYRRLCNAETGYYLRGEYASLMGEIAPNFLAFSPEYADLVVESVTPITLARVRRSGRASAADCQQGQHYTDTMSDLEIGMVRELFWLSCREGFLIMLLLLRLGDIPLERVALLVLPLLWSRPEFPDQRAEKLLQFAFALDLDRREGKISGWRLAGTEKRIKRLQRLIAKQANSNSS